MRYSVERHPTRPGYTIRDSEPRYQNGEDVEGVGWVAYNPPNRLPATLGWWKRKRDAVVRATVLNGHPCAEGVNVSSGFVVHSRKGWPFLRKLAESGAVQWTECVSMAQRFGTREEAEVEAVSLAARTGLLYELEILTVAEAKLREKSFSERAKLAW